MDPQTARSEAPAPDFLHGRNLTTSDGDGLTLSRVVCRRRREPGECAGRSVAIRNHCIECMGYNATEVRECTSPKCWLYPWRMGRLDRDALEIESIHAANIAARGTRGN